MSYVLKKAKHKAARKIAHSFYVHINELKCTVSVTAKSQRKVSILVLKNINITVLSGLSSLIYI